MLAVKKYYKIYGMMVFIILAFGGLATGLKEQDAYSENENRYLDAFPEVSGKDILSGAFQKDYESAFSDQFVGRDIWMGETTVVEKILGKKEINGVYLGKEGYYIPKVTNEEIDQKQYMKNLRYVEYLGKSAAGSTSLLLAPSSGTILKEKLPEKAPYYDEKAYYRVMNTVLKKVKKIDVRSTLKEYAKQNQVYFRTDHHWTLLGAYAAYSYYCDKNKLEKHTYGYFQPEKVSDSFYGTMYSKVLDPATQADTVFAPSNIPQASVYCDGKEKKGIYAVEKLTQKDKYAYFFGGNFGTVTIKTSGNVKEKMLVIKDSYANSFIPFLMDQYDEITMLDLRYYKGSVQNLIKQENYKNILVLYEMSNFAGDTNLYKLVH